MKRLASLPCIAVLVLPLAVGCHGDGMTSDQRFALRQQQSRELHEMMMAQQKSGDAFVAQQMAHRQQPSTAPATP